MTDEKLIEVAKHLIEQAGSFREQARPNVEDFPNSMIGLWMRTADSLAAVLAVFEKAHTPTDDEREDLDKLLAANRVGNRGLVDVIIAAGYHRFAMPRFPYVSEWEQPETIIERVLDDAGYDLYEPWRTSVVNAIAAWVNEAGVAAEPQGEPSDAQVERARIIADLKEWARPLGNSPEEDTLRLVIARIERASVTEQGEN